MPELPEVETTARLVRPGVEGRHVRDARVLWERTLGGGSPGAFRDAIAGATIAHVGRRAKWVVMDLERDGSAVGSLLCHLRMSGRLVVDPDGTPDPPFLRVELTLEDDGGARSLLRFLDVRKFGRFRYVADAEAALADLGPEPLGESFTADWFARELRRRRRSLKPLLLDQTFLAGLGNIYVDESLFLAGLHPLRRSDRVPRDRANALHAAIQETLRAAIEREGSSFDTFYRTPEGQPGSYQDLFRVYGRDGRPCVACGRPVKKLVVGQRGTHICTRCQPAPRPR
ncbi:MAG: bifunctional DNA-formamidopyrimidine glycosylase/DNA-(apurinic or apyrimidinic site) lyase [Planctomycetota bacterium]